MSILKGCIIAALALAAGAVVERAHADEAYVCDGGRIVYVKPGELELKKQQDACIAGYFDNVPSVQRSGTQKADTGPRAANAVVEASPATAQPALEHSNTRNVRIINAAPGADPWFRRR